MYKASSLTRGGQDDRGEGAAASVLLPSSWPWNWSGSTGGMYTGLGGLCKQDTADLNRSPAQPSPCGKVLDMKNPNNSFALFATYHLRQSLQPVGVGL